MSLSPKQKRFCEEYMIDLNATQAAIRAGYSVKTAGQIGEQNLKKLDISRKIEQLQAERSRRTGLHADRVLQELAKIAFVNPVDVIDTETATVKSADPDDTAAIASVRQKTFPTKAGEIGIEREIKFYDKVKALELLGKHLGLFSDKISLESALPVIISGADDLED